MAGNAVALPTGNTFSLHLQDLLVPQYEEKSAAPQDGETVFHLSVGSLAARQNAERVVLTHTGKTRTNHRAVEVGSNGSKEKEVKMKTGMRGKNIGDLIGDIEESKIANGLDPLFVMEARSLQAKLCAQRDQRRRRKRKGLR